MSTIPVRKINLVGKTNAFHDHFFIQSLFNKTNDLPIIEPLHRHDFHFILALYNANGYHEIDFTSYNVRDYSFFFIKPGQVHQLMLKPKSSGYLLHFSPDAFHSNKFNECQLLNKITTQNHYQLNQSFCNELFNLLHAIFEEYTYQKQGYEEIIRANLSILFTKIIRDLHPPSASSNRYHQERLEEFLRLTEMHIANKKQVSQYADMMNLSVYQLNSIVKKQLDKNCSEVIKEQIILEAKRHLLATTNLVNQISLALGYEDVSYFIRFFRKQTRLSPNAFRKKFK